MANYYPQNQQQQQQQQSQYGAQNLQFYQSSYGNPVSGHSTPAQASYGGGPYPTTGGPGTQSFAYGGATGFMQQSPGFGAHAGSGVSGRMGEQGGLRTGWLAAFGTEGYEGEPPLLEELGVNFGHIKVKTLTVLNPMAEINQNIMDDADLFGPIIFCLLFGTFLLFSGKVHFGYIYGLAAIGSTSLHWVFNLMSNPQLDSSHSHSMSGGPPPAASYDHHGNMTAMGSSGHHDHPAGQSTLTFFRSCSVLGYCLLPLVIMSMVGVVLPMDSAIGYIIMSAAVFWCTYSSSKMFCSVGRMHSMRLLVAYPLGLFYVGFGIMGIFSSRGSGQLAGKVGL